MGAGREAGLNSKETSQRRTNMTTRRYPVASAALAALLVLPMLAVPTASVQAADKTMAHQAYQGKSFADAVAAGTATREDPIFVAPRACRVIQVSIVAQAASTGDNTNRKNLNILNKGSAGSGTTEVANLDLVTGTNLVAFDEKVIPLNATFAAGVTLAAGDVLSLQTEQVGTGVAVGPFDIAILWEPV